MGSDSNKNFNFSKITILELSLRYFISLLLQYLTQTQLLYQ